MNALVRALAEVWVALARTFVDVFRGVSIFPTVLANALAPFVGGTITVEVGRPRGDFERRIQEITDQLQKSGSDAQALLDELAQVMEARQQQVRDAHASLLALQMEEYEVQERVAALKSVRPEAAGAITALLDESLEERDKRGARRDWLIFGMGVLATAIVSLIFFLMTEG